MTDLTHEPIQRTPVYEAVLARLQTLTGLGTDPTTGQPAVYDGEVPAADKIALALGVDGTPDPSGRVAPYVVLYELYDNPLAVARSWRFGGTGSSYEGVLADDDVSTTITYQVTVVAGWQRDCLALIDQVQPLLYRWQPTVDGLNCGRLQTVGQQYGPRRDTSLAPLPDRFYAPLQYALTVFR